MNLKDNFFKSSEDLVSMFLGIVIVLIAGGLIFNYFQKRSGNVSLNGVSVTESPTSSVSTTPTLTPSENKKEITPTQAQPQVLNEGEYVVKNGDSLWKIAASQLGSGYKWKEIAQANNLKNPGSLAVGQKLNLKDVNKEVIAEGKGAGEELSYGPRIDSENYVVVKGDSLSKIAFRAYGDIKAWEKLYSANRQVVRNPNLIMPGWDLKIPR